MSKSCHCHVRSLFIATAQHGTDNSNFQFLVTYRQTARRTHWPRRRARSSWRLDPCYWVSCHGCNHCVRYLNERAAAAAPTTTGGREQAQARRGRCSRTWPAESGFVCGGCCAVRRSTFDGRGLFWSFVCGRMEMFRESSEALLHTVSEKGSQLQR